MMRSCISLFLITSSISTLCAADVTFNKHVAPLVFEHCSRCHRPGEVAPFSLLNYRDVSKRAEQIRDITASHAMPPWKPVPGHGEFSNGRRLSKQEIEVISRWVSTGATEGDAADLPPTPKFANGWQLGTPDLIVTLPEQVSIPADGRDLYINIVLPLAVPEGKYLRAAEFRPSNRRVVHHAVLFCDATGKCRERDAAEPGLGFTANTPPAKLLPGTMSIWVPGRNPLSMPEGAAMPWPKNADLIVNLHLHPTGKPEVEQSSIGFYFTDEKPQRPLMDFALIDKNIDIPPGEKTFRTHASRVLSNDAEVLSVFPHMHMIGKEIKVTATLPDGTTRPLLWIDDWNFNWQDLYHYVEPVSLPKGTTITLDAVHDNSADNPLNPRNPPERVRWGEQTFDEMSIAYLEMLPAKVASTPKPAATVKLADVKPADVAAFAAEALRKADTSRDGKLSLEEIRVATGNRDTVAEIEKRIQPFDRDGDNQLDLTEATEAIKALRKK